MPQMFPLLWLILFLLTASALFTMMSSIHFSKKSFFSFNSSKTSESKNHGWKW